MSEVQSTFRLRPGVLVADFSLPAPCGSVRSRAGLGGTHGLLVVFACNHCPYVIHVADALVELAREIARRGVHTVAVNSNDTAKFPQDGPEQMIDFGAQHRWQFPYLIDESQEVAKSYGAACTPDFFLIDGAGRLFYTGQFDETRPRSGAPAHGADLRAAVWRMLAGQEPLVRATPSCGCNIKWKAGNQPPWWNVGG
jgi:peroxiredoxin